MDNRNKYKGLIMVIFSIAIIGLFMFLIVEPFIFPGADEGLNGVNKYMLSTVSVQLGMITAWLYNNNNNKKK